MKDIVFRRYPVGGDEGSRTREEARLGSPNYLLTACCKSCYQRCWRLPAFPRPPQFPFARFARPCPLFALLTVREPRTGYSSLAVSNDGKQRTETNGASTDSDCYSRRRTRVYFSQRESCKRSFCNFKTQGA